MIEHDAIDLAGKLVVATTGWNDTAVDGLIERMTHEWKDPALGGQAVEEIIHSWTRSSRPTWAVLDEAYKRAKHRQEMERSNVTAIGSRRNTLSFAEGIQVAYRSYCAEVKRQGREPQPFERFAGELAATTRGEKRKVQRR